MCVVCMARDGDANAREMFHAQGAAVDDRAQFFVEMNDHFSLLDYLAWPDEMVTITGMTLNEFNLWHHNNWPASNLSQIRGPNFNTLLRMKWLQLGFK